MRRRSPIVPFRRWILAGMLSLVALSGCSVRPQTGGNHSFITYWPPPAGTEKLRLGVKDNIDMRGVVTTAGSAYLAKNNPPARQDAPCLALARQRDVIFVGKTNLSEFAVAPSGFNEYFGTPKSPLSRWYRRVPGGSSSGSAVAVASGLADVTFGTDTAGSVRVPAACCGIVGLKTTYGLVPIEGVYPIDPQHLDTVGPLAKDIADTVRGMDLLQSGFAARYEAEVAAHPEAGQLRIGRLRLPGTDAAIDRAVDEALARTGFQVVTLSDDFRKKWEQAKDDGNTLAAGGAWLSDRQYFGKPGVSTRTNAAILVGRLAYPAAYRAALARRPAWQKALQRTLREVDLIALPTLQTAPPVIVANLKLGILEAIMLELQNTVPVNVAGNPALALPIPLRKYSVRVTSLQFVGPRRGEAELLNAGRLVEQTVWQK